MNGNSLSDDFDITSQNIFGLATAIGNAADLNDYKAPGLYYQPQNSQAQAGVNYPEPQAGSLEIYKHVGITQIYRFYGSSRSYIRTLYGVTWSGWARQYDTENKPTPGDIGALALDGDAATATKLKTARAINGVMFDGSKNISIPSLGIGQTVQNVTSLRALGVTYTNSTGKPIAVGVAVRGGISLTTTASLNGVPYCYDASTATNASGNGVWFVVPDGMTYSVECTQTAATITFWTELR
ncbi:pyocin knob domain-containing protein [Citrobacter portucalensis]|uniref:pyocin knob domain-containing protein n=1 Tax=Citrobacter portucalensis TaxID=1639133 RepID=UPI003AADF249